MDSEYLRLSLLSSSSRPWLFQKSYLQLSWASGHKIDLEKKRVLRIFSMLPWARIRFAICVVLRTKLKILFIPFCGQRVKKWYSPMLSSLRFVSNGKCIQTFRKITILFRYSFSCHHSHSPAHWIALWVRQKLLAWFMCIYWVSFCWCFLIVAFCCIHVKQCRFFVVVHSFHSFLDALSHCTWIDVLSQRDKTKIYDAAIGRMHEWLYETPQKKAT